MDVFAPWRVALRVELKRRLTVENIVRKIVVSGVLAAMLAVSSWAEGFNSQISGPLVEVDGYNAVLGAIAPFSGPTAPLNLRFSDLGLEFRGRAVDLDPYNLTLGTVSAPRTVDNPYESYAYAPGYARPLLWEIPATLKE
jgi:hypothetical protein